MVPRVQSEYIEVKGQGWPANLIIQSTVVCATISSDKTQGRMVYSIHNL